jgi:soluble lytic murein transglycosylase-like protein
MTASERLNRGMRTLATRIVKGVFEITHSGVALVGLAVMFSAIALAFHPDVRVAGEVKLMGWLQHRLVATAADGTGSPVADDADAVDRATATDPSDLPKAQASLAYWLSKKYHVAPEPVSALVSEAFDLGSQNKLDPTLILAVMAVESGFNPFAQSPVGAQGLMQVMTKVHSDKYEDFGGKLAAFDPLTNLRVGVKVLKDCVTRAGSVEDGLRLYVGAGNSESDGGYAAKVLAEQGRLRLVSGGRTVPLNPPQVGPVQVIPVVHEPKPLNERVTESVTEKVAALFAS